VRHIANKNDIDSTSFVKHHLKNGHCICGTTCREPSDSNITGVILASFLEQNEQQKNALKEEVQRLQKSELYDAIKKIK